MKTPSFKGETHFCDGFIALFVVLSRNRLSTLLIEASLNAEANRAFYLEVAMNSKVAAGRGVMHSIVQAAVLTMLTVAAGGASAAVSCSFGDVAGGNAGNTSLGGTSGVGTDPTSFSLFANYGGALSNSLDCYSFTSTSAFQISGYLDFFLNLDPAGTILKNTSGDYFSLNSNFNNYTNAQGSWSSVFAAGDYALLVYTNATGYSSNPDVYGGKAFIRSVSAVPEPETYAMLLAGLGIVGFVGRRRLAQRHI